MEEIISAPPAGAEESDTLSILKSMKRAMTYRKLAKLTGTTEQSLIRWITGKNTISPAWESIIRRNLSK